MIRIIILISLLFSCNIPIEEVNVEKIKYAEFNLAYSYLRKFEGNYGWYKSTDPGGETYAGIARNYNKKWVGWAILDNYKKTHKINHNDSIPLLEFHTFDYYRNVWETENYGMIRNQEIANYLFDYRNSGYIVYKHVRYILSKMGYLIEPHGMIDGRMIFLINIVNEKEFLDKLKHTRMQYYIWCVKRRPDQVMFLFGWHNRVYNINS